jgi:hypothetical protein
MKIRILPSVVGTAWRDDFKMFGPPKQILFQHLKEYRNHIALYDLTIEEFAKLANSNNKKKKWSRK